MWPRFISNSNRQGLRWYSARVNHNDHKSLIGKREVPRYLQNCSCYTAIKNPSLDRNELSNFRPVSGLNFVSKLIVKIVASQIKSHLQNSGISNDLQSAYKFGNSTETALLYIQNDILSAQDRGELNVLLLLDLSAAFDTIDHDLLLSRLTEWFGINGVVLQWVRSYLTSRSQLVKVNSVLSTPQLSLCGVPQGSVLGPLLFYYAYYSSQFNNNSFRS